MIKLTFNTSRHPQVKGQAEGTNQTILAPLRAGSWSSEEKNWDVNLKQIARDINSSINKTTGRPHFEALYGYLPRFEEGPLRELTANCETYQDPRIVLDDIMQGIVKSQLKFKNGMANIETPVLPMIQVILFT